MHGVPTHKQRSLIAVIPWGCLSWSPPKTPGCWRCSVALGYCRSLVASPLHHSAWAARAKLQKLQIWGEGLHRSSRAWSHHSGGCFGSSAWPSCEQKAWSELLYSPQPCERNHTCSPWDAHRLEDVGCCSGSSCAPSTFVSSHICLSHFFFFFLVFIKTEWWGDAVVSLSTGFNPNNFLIVSINILYFILY